MCLYSSVIQP